MALRVRETDSIFQILVQIIHWQAFCRSICAFQTVTFAQILAFEIFLLDIICYSLSSFILNTMIV